GNPKHRTLVDSIENISNAINISAFWVGRPQDLPDNTHRWYELWIDTQNDDEQNIIDNVFAKFDELGLTHKEKNEKIRFPERVVIPIFANNTQLLNIIACSTQGIRVAEIRKPAEPNVFFLTAHLKEQTGWADDLERRIQFTDSGATVCLLDTGVERNHRLLLPHMPMPNQTINMVWGTDDLQGHGTEMAGVALFDDIKSKLITAQPIQINHTIESVKILPDQGINLPTLYGNITEQAALLSEISNPQAHRVFCMAVTDGTSGLNDGSPSSWSAAVDQISSDEAQKRLFIIPAGNTKLMDLQTVGYPAACINKSVEDPAQAWNALTVGAYSNEVESTTMPTGYRVVANVEELSPYSSTSCKWQRQWPIKPEVICDGGNVATDGINYTNDDDLSRLTFSREITTRLFEVTCATSAASAQCAYIAAELNATYPQLWAETTRALIVHSARWSDRLVTQFTTHGDTQKQKAKKLLRICGYGIPNLERARDTLNNSVNMIIQSEIQPYEKVGGIIKTKDMNLHEIPWPSDLLARMGNTIVKVRLTLSYFIQPGPGEKGWGNKYRYASCGLRFDIKRSSETDDEFKMRMNAAMRDDDFQITRQEVANDWHIGSDNRNVGSVHSDVLEDTAIKLSQSNLIGVYPVVGWWRERKTLNKHNSRIRYSLIVTIETPDTGVDLYTPIMTRIATGLPVESVLI
ncbi:MAG: S8 family peptidase, partial [Christensenellaceae bacterium]|nr:S8 family peptidase [Christensenellaceae bacterium]